MRRAKSTLGRPFDTESPANAKNIEIIFSDDVSAVCGPANPPMAQRHLENKAEKLPPQGFPGPENNRKQ
jgi:hypothetical protein